MSFLKAHQRSLSFTDPSSPLPLLFWLLQFLVSPYAPAACPAIWRSLASCLPVSMFAASLPEMLLPDCPIQSPLVSPCFLISVFRHVAELTEWNNTKFRVSSNLVTRASAGTPASTVIIWKTQSVTSEDKTQGLLMSMIATWLKLLFWGWWGIIILVWAQDGGN